MTAESAQHLADELKRKFDANVVETEEVSLGRFRFAIISAKFAGVPPLTRQDLAWETIDGIVSREDNLDISLVLTFAPEDVQLTGA